MPHLRLFIPAQKVYVSQAIRKENFDQTATLEQDFVSDSCFESVLRVPFNPARLSVCMHAPCIAYLRNHIMLAKCSI